jgi:predicted Zn-dependent protease with MMP-like domain
MHRNFYRIFFTCVFLIMSVTVSHAFELNSQYVTIMYENEDLLRKFNREVSLGSLSYLARNKKSLTVSDEAKNKVDTIVERVESILDMFPLNLKFKIVLLFNDTDVNKVFMNKYGRNPDYISFYAPSDKTVYISVADIRLGVLAHELAHVIIDHYFVNPPPEKIHEVLAQFVETHLSD